MAHYQIAGLTVEMNVTGRTLRQAAPYQIHPQEKVDMVIQCSSQEVLEQAPELGNLDDALYIGTGSMFSAYLLRFNGFQLHSSAVMLDGKAYLFSAPSGTGKSTHTEKWCRLFGAQLLNDDKPALRYQQEEWIAYGTPWSGKHDLSTPVGVPLGGIAFLERGQENEIHRLSPGEAVPDILRETLRALPASQISQLLGLVDRLLQEIPVWKLRCRNDDEAALVSYGAMTKE